MKKTILISILCIFAFNSCELYRDIFKIPATFYDVSYRFTKFYGDPDEVKKYDNVNFIMTPSHQISAMLSYYTDEKYFTYIDEKLTRKSQFNLWEFPKQYYGANGLYINTDDMTLEPYKEYFTSFDTPNFLTIYRKGFPIRGYRITYSKGLRKIG